PGEYEGKVYEAPVRIDGDVTLKAVAVREGKAPSKVSEASYKLGGRLVSPAADVKSRAFAERTPFTVRLSGPEGAEIRYTTDGSDPGPGRGRVYSAPLSLTPPVVLKAVSVKAGMRTSGVMSESYNINSVLMVKITGGTFRMGSNENSDEKPIHSVTVDSFWMGKFEVTQKEWQSVMGTNPSNFKGEDLPVENVSWYDTVKFCNKLSEQDGYDPVYTINGTQVTCDFTKNGYRLPTEAEWEYVARGGNQSRGYTYAGSNSAGTVAWYWDNSGKKTHPVGTKQPNELGLYDMSGNVWEWCWDRYDGNYYAQSPSKNPKGKSEGSYRVLRGGSWRFEEEYLQTTKRNYGDSSNTNNHRGFRLVRTSKNE
ncbi:MAG TPA: SUMF1/EgtB/PvdO family nonheme iron enzyme, partial [Candidatus Mcinerneyibacteriales bacterium]|nr:SUMF1/EgtB/PvdO family nonheme iron enzyme [Candidatus Mcinerneyibacteriales bacterium]